MQKIRKGDTVIAITGKYKGKTGEVLKICEDGRIIVEGINVVKKSVKPNPNLNQPGGIIDKEIPIHISNVSLYDGSKASRVGIRVSDDNKKERFYKTTNEVIKG